MIRYIDVDVARRIIDSPRSKEQMLLVLSQAEPADVIPIEWIKEQKDKCFPYSVTAITLNGLLMEWEGREDEQIH